MTGDGRRVVARRIGLVVLLALTAACGQTGPLYLPDDDATAAPAAEATENDADDDRNESER